MSYTDEQIEAVWSKGTQVSNNDPRSVRQDVCGAWIVRNEYANRKSEFGWEIDHINPKGTDDLSNLQPLQWENNVRKSDGSLSCPVVADGIHNKKRF